MLTAFSLYNLNGLSDAENETPSQDAPCPALPLALLRRSMSDFANGARLVLPEDMEFRDLISPGAGFLSLGHTFTLGNPDKAKVRKQETGREEALYEAPLNPAMRGRNLRAEADDFRYLCRLFGVRFSAVEDFRIRNLMTFIPNDGPEGNVLSYQLAEIIMDRRYEAGVTSFYELVRNKGGNNFILYWEALPDIFGELRTGEARGCTVQCEALAVRSVVSDDSRAAAELPLVLPTVERLAALIGRLYRVG